jgi:hypothetical protein
MRRVRACGRSRWRGGMPLEAEWLAGTERRVEIAKQWVLALSQRMTELGPRPTGVVDQLPQRP